MEFLSQWKVWKVEGLEFYNKQIYSPWIIVRFMLTESLSSQTCSEGLFDSEHNIIVMLGQIFPRRVVDMDHSSRLQMHAPLKPPGMVGVGLKMR